MKYVFLSLAVLTASCGKIESVGGSGGVGEIRQLQAVNISTADALIYDSICQAMTSKASKLTASLPNSLQFDVVEKDCQGSTVTFGTQQVRVERDTTGEFLFRRQDSNALFLFPSVETTNYGFMKGVCGASQLPVISGDTATWVSRSGVNNTDCPPNGNEVCVVVEKGVRQPNLQNSYRIHTREFVRFNITSTSGKYGYFTHRKAFAENNCDDGKFTQSTATLR